MSTGTKVLLGCGIAVVVVVLGVAVLFVGGVFWAKNKAEKYVADVTARTEEIDRYEKEANRHAFTAPADGLLSEPQLVKFLEVRKQIFAVYEQHKAEFDSLAARTADKKQLSLGETVEAGTLIARLAADVRLAQMKGLAAIGMSEPEYRYIQEAVYKSAWGRELQKSGAPQVSDQVGAMADAGAAVPGGKTALEEMQARAKALDVPQANIELFRKYEADIQKYAMTGLALVGL